MVVGTGEAFANSATRTTTTEYFFIEIEGHYECCKLVTIPLGKKHNRCELSSAPCCPGRVSHAVVQHKAALRISDRIELGYWSWIDSGPKRLSLDVNEGRCEEKRDALLAKIQPRYSNLKERFDTAKAEQNPKLRARSFQEILKLIETAEKDDHNLNPTLKQDVLFSYYGDVFERIIRDGITALQSASSEKHRRIFCRVVDFRSNPSKNLCEIFDEDVAHTTSQNAKAQWLPKFSASTATVVARANDAQFSESGDRGTEREASRQGKLAHIVHRIIDELIPARQIMNRPEGPIPGPVIGVNALIICSALKEKPFFFAKALRQIHSNSVPGFARHIACRLQDINWSELPAAIAVAFPLFLVSWAMRKQFSDVCESLGLPNLAGLRLDLTSKLDQVEMRWRLATQNWETMTAAEINRAEAQLDQDLQILLGDLQRVAPRTAEVSASEHLGPDHDPASPNAECVGETESVASGERSLFMPSQASIDSGYLSNTGSQQVHGTTSVVSSSGALLFEMEGGAELVRPAAGQKRPQVRDNAASKRHRPSAADTSETTENSDTGIEASTADPAVRSLRNTDSGVLASQNNGTTPTTDVSADPSQEGPLQGLAEAERNSDVLAGSGMEMMPGHNFWAGTGMDMMDCDLEGVDLTTPSGFLDLTTPSGFLDLTTPSGFLDFSRAEQPCESSPPVAESEIEHQAE